MAARRRSTVGRALLARLDGVENRSEMPSYFCLLAARSAFQRSQQSHQARLPRVTIIKKREHLESQSSSICVKCAWSADKVRRDSPQRTRPSARLEHVLAYLLTLTDQCQCQSCLFPTTTTHHPQWNPALPSEWPCGTVTLSRPSWRML